MIRRFLQGQRHRAGDSSTSIFGKAFKAGDLLTVLAEDGQFGVMKVLVVDDHGIHVRLFTERFKERPQLSELHGLTVMPAFPEHTYQFSFGHMPFTFSSFTSWEPQVLGFEPVSEEELAGYRLWQKENGDYF